MNPQEFKIPGLELIFTQRPINLRAVTLGEKVRQQMEESLPYFSKKPRQIFTCNQVHSDIIFTVKELDQGQDFYYGRIFRDGDGLVTNLENVALVAKVADCVPILLFDPKNKAQASLHSGWRGTLAQISKKALNIMEEEYNSRSEDIFAYIGPCISWDSFEVMEDVSSKWFETFSFAKDVVKDKDADHQLIDLKESNRRILLEAGIKEENIIVSKESTYENLNLHSFRRDQPDYGVNAMISMLVSE